MTELRPPTRDEIDAARGRLRGVALRTPLVRLEYPESPLEVWLKLECLQPIGSFKLRGAYNALAQAGAGRLSRGVYTASAGNMAQGVAWSARELGVACSVVVPDGAPRTKVEAVERLGGRVVPVPYDEWWQVLVRHEADGMEGLFVHPVSDQAVITGNATIGAEILDDLPETATILVPYGGGGLSCGIAAAALARSPATRVLACEVETAAPLGASLAAGSPQAVEHRRSFVDGIGGKSVLAEMWPLASALLAGARTASLEQIRAAMRLLAQRARVVAEGAGAAPLAVALTHAREMGDGPVVCVVSGGNVDLKVLAAILGEEA